MSKREWHAVDLAVVGLGTALVFFFAGAAVVLAVKGNAPTAFWAAGSAVAGGLLGLLVEPPGQTPDTNQLATTVAGDLTNSAALRAATAAAAAHLDQPNAAAAAVGHVRQRSVVALEQAKRNVAAQATPATAAQAGAQEIAQNHRAAAAAAQQQLAQAQQALTATQAAGAQHGIDEAQATQVTAAINSHVLTAAADAAEQSSLEATNNAVTAVAGTRASRTPQQAGLVLGIVFVALVILAVVLASGVIGVHHGYDHLAMDNVTKTILSLASAAGSALIGLYAPSPPSGTGAVTSAS